MLKKFASKSLHSAGKFGQKSIHMASKFGQKGLPMGIAVASIAAPEAAIPLAMAEPVIRSGLKGLQKASR